MRGKNKDSLAPDRSSPIPVGKRSPPGRSPSATSPLWREQLSTRASLITSTVGGKTLALLHRLAYKLRRGTVVRVPLDAVKIKKIFGICNGWQLAIGNWQLATANGKRQRQTALHRTARVAELADAPGLGPGVQKTCGFESRSSQLLNGSTANSQQGISKFQVTANSNGFSATDDTDSTDIETAMSLIRCRNLECGKLLPL